MPPKTKKAASKKSSSAIAAAAAAEAKARASKKGKKDKSTFNQVTSLPARHNFCHSLVDLAGDAALIEIESKANCKGTQSCAGHGSCLDESIAQTVTGLAIALSMSNISSCFM